MTRTQLEELANWHEAQSVGNRWPDDRKFHRDAAAAIRELLAQEPVAWMHYYRKPGKGYSCADIGEHGPDPDEGFVHISKEPLYAVPVPAFDLEAFKAEAMRLALDVATGRATITALAAHLDLIGGK